MMFKNVSEGYPEKSGRNFVVIREDRDHIRYYQFARFSVNLAEEVYDFEGIRALRGPGFWAVEYDELDGKYAVAITDVIAWLELPSLAEGGD